MKTCSGDDFTIYRVKHLGEHDPKVACEPLTRTIETYLMGINNYSFGLLSLLCFHGHLLGLSASDLLYVAGSICDKFSYQSNDNCA